MWFLQYRMYMFVFGLWSLIYFENIITAYASPDQCPRLTNHIFVSVLIRLVSLSTLTFYLYGKNIHVYDTCFIHFYKNEKSRTIAECCCTLLSWIGFVVSNCNSKIVQYNIDRRIHKQNGRGGYGRYTGVVVRRHFQWIMNFFMKID